MKWTICSLIMFCLLASPAAAEEIRVHNASDKPIYQLFAWASDLTASTENLIIFPLAVNDIETVTIDNDWAVYLPDGLEQPKGSAQEILHQPGYGCLRDEYMPAGWQTD